MTSKPRDAGRQEPVGIRMREARKRRDKLVRSFKKALGTKSLKRGVGPELQLK